MPSTRIIKVLHFHNLPAGSALELITKAFTPKTNRTSMSREEVSAMVDVGTTEEYSVNRKAR